MFDVISFQLEAKESKLSSSMNSIKTFWSPELKKERALRKDEATKMSVWKEQYRMVQEETQVGKKCVCVCLLVAESQNPVTRVIAANPGNVRNLEL